MILDRPPFGFKNLTFFGLALVLTTSVVFWSCDKEEEEDVDDGEYHLIVHSPDTLPRLLGEMVPIKVEFINVKGGTVHNVNVSICRKTDDVYIYSAPTESNVKAKDRFMFEGEFLLSEENGVPAPIFLVVDARVWGETPQDRFRKREFEFKVELP